MNIWVIMIAVMVLSYIIQAMLNSKFNKYSRVPSPHGLTGADIARLMLKQNGINDVDVVSTPGRLTDHYNPADKTVNFSFVHKLSKLTIYLKCEEDIEEVTLSSLNGEEIVQSPKVNDSSDTSTP